MKVLLLGGNGLLGHNVLEALQERHHAIRLLARDRHFLDEAKDLAEIIEGSLLDIPTLHQAAQGCDAIINCAGTTDMALLHYEDYLPVNRDAVQNILQVMEQTGISNLVHVSTANTIGNGTTEHPATEDYPIAPPFVNSYYAQSKLEGERLVQAAAKRHPDWHLILVNPGFMIGAYDRKPSSGQLLLAADKRPLMVVPRGGKTFLHVADAADAIVNALYLGRNGERYLLTGQSLSLKEFYGLQRDIRGYRQRIWTLPNWPLLIAGRIGDLLQHAGIHTQLCTRNIRQLLVMEYYSDAKARSELSMPCRPIRCAIQDFFTWREKQA